MKLPIVILILATGWMQFVDAATQTAQARLYCYSVRMERGVAGFGGTLDLSTLDWSVTPNGELAPLFTSHSHGSGFSLHSPGFLEPIRGVLRVDAPLGTDVNGNGYADFFEVDQSVARVVTAGNYSAGGNETGTVTATWTRSPGSRTGSCTLALVSAVFGTLGEFQHTFEITEYHGELHYQPASSVIEGTVNLQRIGVEAETLSGPISILKSPQDPENELALAGGAWTNSVGQEYRYVTDLLFRQESNYFGYVEFADGNLATTGEDYWLWAISIDDPNDRDGNGIPDLSDVPPTSPERPELRLDLVPDATRLTVMGTAGTTYELEETADVSGSDWTTVRLITATNSTETILLPRPTGGTKFWRLAISASNGG
jgi:hypothetical protein